MLSYLLWLFVKGILLVLLSIILLYAGREYIAYQNLQFFKKQGVKCYYTPIIGFVFYWIKPKDGNDAMSKMRKLLEDNKDEPLIMFNTSKIIKSIGFLLDDNLIRELAIKELENTIKIEFMKDTHLGFFFQNGEKFQHARAAYVKFFNFDNLKKLTSKLGKLTNKVLGDFAGQLREARARSEIENTSTGGWTKLKVKDLLNKVFTEITNSILFGEEEKLMFDGVDLTIAIQGHVDNTFKINLIPINTLSLGFLHEWGILPQTRNLRKEYEKLRERCWLIFQSRLVSGPKKDPNLLDLLVTRNNENLEQGKPGLNKDDVVDDFLMLQFAAADTSLQVSCSSIMQLKRLPEHQKVFQGFCDEAFNSKPIDHGLDYEDIERNDLYEQYILEFMRIGAPASTITSREFLKPTKLGKFNFRAGDRILVPSGLNHTWTKYWNDPQKFDPNRMSKENLKNCVKSAFMPFGFGRRICIGKSLGEITVKVMLLTFFRYFDVQADNDHTEVRMNSLTYGYENPSVLVRPRDLK